MKGWKKRSVEHVITQTPPTATYRLQSQKSTRVDTETDLKAACLLYKGLQLDFSLQSLSLYGKNFMACCACFTFHEQVLPFLWFFLVLVVIWQCSLLGYRNGFVHYKFESLVCFFSTHMVISYGALLMTDSVRNGFWVNQITSMDLQTPAAWTSLCSITGLFERYWWL